MSDPPDAPDDAQATEVLTLDLRVYPIGAIKKTAYELSSLCYMQIELRDDTHAAVVFTSSTSRPDELVQLTRLFVNRLLVIALQDRIADEVRPIREALTNAALYESLKPHDG